MTLEEIDLSLPNGFHDSTILGVRLDYVQPTANPLLADAFTYWFFINNWNAFIHVAALGAKLVTSIERA